MTCSPISSAESIGSERRPSQHDDRIGETAAEAEPAAVDEPGVSVEEPGAIEQKLDATF